MFLNSIDLALIEESAEQLVVDEVNDTINPDEASNDEASNDEASNDEASNDEASDDEDVA
jgi:hypothetical protein